MCRGDIPPTFLDNPKLLEPLKTEVGHDDAPEIEAEHNSANEEANTDGLSDSEPLQEQEQSAEEQSDEGGDKFCWFYEGRNGWWQYDARTSQELESFHQNGELTCELLIAGFLYTIDFRSMVQFRRNEPNRRRQIKRDLATISKKGIAGLRLHNNGLPLATTQTQSLSGLGSTSGASLTSNPMLSLRTQLNSQSPYQGLRVMPRAAALPTQYHPPTIIRAVNHPRNTDDLSESSDEDRDYSSIYRELDEMRLDPDDDEDD